jgi:hypothetical protein
MIVCTLHSDADSHSRLDGFLPPDIFFLGGLGFPAKVRQILGPRLKAPTSSAALLRRCGTHQSERRRLLDEDAQRRAQVRGLVVVNVAPNQRAL